MKKNTLEKLQACLSRLSPRLEVEEGVRLRAKKSIDRMLEMTAGLTLAAPGNRG